jgi:hypothetical protein
MILQKAKTYKEREPWEKKADIIGWLILIFAVIYFAPIIIRAFCR